MSRHIRSLASVITVTVTVLVGLGRSQVFGQKPKENLRELRTETLMATVTPRGLTAVTVVGEKEPLLRGLYWRWLRRGKKNEWPGTMNKPLGYRLMQAPDGTITLLQTYKDFDFAWGFSTGLDGRSLKVDCTALARRDFRSGAWGTQMPQANWTRAVATLYPTESGIGEMPDATGKPVFPKANWVAVKREQGLASVLVVGLAPGWKDDFRILPGMFTNSDWPKQVRKGDELRMSYLLAPYTDSLEMALQEFLPKKQTPRIDLPLGFAFWPAHSLEMIPLAAAKTAGRLSTADAEDPFTVRLCRGEVEPFQLVFTPAAGKVFTGLSLGFSELRHADGQATLPASTLSWRRVRYLNRTYADVLEPVDQFDTIAGATNNYPLWVSLAVPRDAVPGDYAGTISLLHEEDVLVSVPLWVHVWDFELPEKSSFNTAIFGFWPNFVEAHYGVPGKSDALKKMLRDGCESLAAHHIVHGHDEVGVVPWRPSVDYLMTPQGEADFLGWCQFWVDRGLRLGEVRVYREDFWKHYWPIFREKGWDREIYSAHGGEYATLERAKEAVAVAEKLRKVAPGLRFMSTAIGPSRTVHEAADPGTEIWCTTPRVFTKLRGFFEGRLLAGEKVWLYIHHHIRFTADASAPRTFFWQLSRLGLDGCCLYSLNCWGNDPMNWTPEGLVQEKTYYGYPLGAGVLYWPGEKAFLESVRLKKVRDGIEDWMFLRMLEERLAEARHDPVRNRTWIRQARIALRLRDALVRDSLIPGSEVFDHASDPATFDEIRTAVGDALAAGRKQGAPPVSTR